MSLLTRLSTWLRSDRSIVTHGGVVEETRLPEVSADLFRRNLLQGLEDAYTKGEVTTAKLDPSVFMLVIPSTYGDGFDEESRLAKDLQDAMSSLRSQRPYLTSLSWSALKDAGVPFTPNYMRWGHPFELALDGDAGIVFFVDLEAIGAYLRSKVSALGLAASLDSEEPLMRVSDSRFEARVGLHALVAEALWTASGPLTVVNNRTRQLPGDFRGYAALIGALRRRFVGVHFELRDNTVHAKTHEASHVLDYRHLVASIRHAGGGFDAWLERATLEDLEELDGSPMIAVKSLSYLKAWPDALTHAQKGYALVAMREQEGRLRPVLRQDNEPAQRWFHHKAESERQVGLNTFEAKLFGFQLDDELCVCLVGDNVASLASSESLIAGASACTHLNESTVVVKSYNESMLMIAREGISERITKAARAFCETLMRHCGFDSDAIELELTMALPENGAGRFEFESVPADYFELMGEVEKNRRTHPSRADYLEGVALFEIGKKQKAKSFLQKALRQDQDAPEANLALGRLLSDQGESDSALPFLTRAADHLPERADAANDLGLALRREDDLENAIKAFERAVAIDPHEPEFLMNLGHTYYEHERFDRAKHTLERALILSPNFGNAHATLALIYDQEKSSAKAKEHAQEAIAHRNAPERSDGVRMVEHKLYQIILDAEESE